MTVVTFFVLLSLLGIFSLRDMPIDLLPDLSPPYVSVVTAYPSAGPEEVETEVTEVLEEQLLNISGLEEITSTSSEGRSSILLEFSWGSGDGDFDSEVRRRIDEIANELPDDARKPVVLQFDPNAQPIMEIAIQGQRSLEELTHLAEALVTPRLEQVKDVAQVEVTGNRSTIVEVSLYQDRLSAYGLSAGAVAQVLGAQNLSLGAGSFLYEDREYLLKTTGTFQSLDDIRNTTISTILVGQEGRKVFLRDIAEVNFAPEDETTRVLVNGDQGINLLVSKQSGANTVEVAQGLQAVVAELRQTLPEGVQLAVLSDSSRIIEQSMAEVLNSAIIGVVASIFVLLFFLRQLRSTLIVAISIPVSILITIFGMSLGGKTFNIIALTGLTLGVGMIVDASIVILENIFRHRQQGVPLAAAARFGTQEMVSPIFGSILTTIAVFLPILILGDQIGSFGAIMGDLAFTVVVSMVASLVVAVFLVPVLAGHYMPVDVQHNSSWIDKTIEAGLSAITRGYRWVLDQSLRHRFFTLLTAVVILGMSFAQIPKLGINLLPGQASEGVQLSIELPVGSALSSTKTALDQIQFFVEQEMTGYENLIQTAGSPSSREGSLVMGLPALETRTVPTADMIGKLSQIASRIPGITYSVAETQGINRNQIRGGGTDLTVSLRGDVSTDELFVVADQVLILLENSLPEVRELGLDTVRGLPQIEIVIDRQKAFDLGLSTSSISSELRAQLYGIEPTTYSEQSKEFPVLIRLRDEDTLTLEDFEKIFVPNSQGQRVALSNFASLQESTGPVGIKHRDTQRTITIGGTFREGASANFVDAKVRQLIADSITLPPGISLEIGGAIDDIEETGSGLLLVLLLAAVLVFGIMVSQFESLKAPFIVFLSMPMLAPGVIGVYLLLKIQFSMISLIGVIMLVGIVVNNGIVLVDYISLLRKRGAGLYEACLEAGVSRLRPILMTTLTTILAMVPLAFFSKEGGALMQPLGVTVVGGLTVNTVVTLVLVPVLYFGFFKREAKKEEMHVEN